MISVLKKEIGLLLGSLIAYLVIAVFLVITGLFTWVFPQFSILNYGYAELSSFFELSPYVFLLLAPALTMRSFAEEKKTGTLELLLTKPFSEIQIIIGKYLGALLVVIIALLPTLIYAYSTSQLASPVGNFDWAGYTSSFVGLVFLAAVFVAIGIFSSLITENQIVAFLSAVFLCFLMFDGLSFISELNLWDGFKESMDQISLSSHFSSMSRGVLDLKDGLYFFSIIVLFLGGSELILVSRKW